MANESTNSLDAATDLVRGVQNATAGKEKQWNDIVAVQIETLVKKYGLPSSSEQSSIQKTLIRWYKNVTLDYKYHESFSPHVNGFYMIFMVHGTWHDVYEMYMKTDNKTGLSKPARAAVSDPGTPELLMTNPGSYFNMLATDIDIPDITEEYTSVSSRLRNSFIPSRNYFVSDFNISYIESVNLDVIRYHEAWFKFMQLITRGEISFSSEDCRLNNSGYFLDMPFANAVWVAVFKPFTTEIQLLIKLIGVMPVTMPLKQVIGNRSQSKMTVLNISYKASDLLYKFYNNTKEFVEDKGHLAESFRKEVMTPTNTTVNT